MKQAITEVTKEAKQMLITPEEHGSERISAQCRNQLSPSLSFPTIFSVFG
jgi:hypothetical protein